MASQQEAIDIKIESVGSPKNYEVAVEELENLVTKMEAGHLQLEESLQAYQRGVTLVSYCQKQLEHIEQQVRILEAGEEGSLKPWSAQDTTADA